jgi:Ca-activated chloride channel family protein
MGFMYRLEEPIYFYLLAIIPIMIVVFLLVLWWKKRTQRKFSNPELLEKLAPNSSTFKSSLKLLMLLLGIAFLVISLVNPKMGSKLQTVKREGVDIVFALDVSKSMLAEDIAPNRLEKAKQIISKIIDQLGSDRIGIIIYAGNAYPLLPITTDHAAANMFLQNANPDMVSSQGTAINEALELAKTYYNNDDQTNRFLIIISDGEDHQEETKQVAQNLNNEGVKIFTIGVGTERGGPIPMRLNNEMIGYKKDNQGETVITKRMPSVLEEIADIAKGRYIDGNVTENPVKIMADIIANAEKNEFETKQFSDYKDQFQWFLGIGILFLLFDIFLFDKKTKWLKKVDLFNEEKTKK